MTMRLNDILTPMKATVQNPRRGLRDVLDQVPEPRTRMLVLLLMAVGSALLTQATLALSPVEGNPLAQFLISSPMRIAVLQVGGMLLTSTLVYFVGRACGGIGSFADAIMAIAWLQLFMLVLQLGEILLMVAGLSNLALFVPLLSLGVFPWFLTMFVTEIHAFQSPAKVLGGIVVTVVATSFLLSFVLVGFLGPEAFQNV